MALLYRESAFKHGICQEQIEDVLANLIGFTKWFPYSDDKDGNPQEMAVGFDAEGKLIEIGITYFRASDVIFHADNATQTWRKKYNEK